MGLKTKATAALASMLIVSGAVSVQANTAVSVQQASTICAGGFAGCVLPGQTKPAPVAPPVQAPAAAPVEEAKGGGIGFLVPVLAAAAIIGGIVVAAGNDDEVPTSP